VGVALSGSRLFFSHRLRGNPLCVHHPPSTHERCTYHTHMPGQARGVCSRPQGASTDRTRMALTHLSALTTTPHTEVVREIMTSPTPKNHHLGAVTVQSTIINNRCHWAGL
jgi:hypothetical protein